MANTKTQAVDNDGLPLRVSTHTTPSDPSTTTNLTGVMLGLGQLVTPVMSGRVFVIVSGDIDNSILGNGAKTQIRYGTGTAPSHGNALTGTAVGSIPQLLNPALTLLVPGRSFFCLHTIISGLSVGTTYWVDVSLAAINAGTARVRNLSFTAFEI